MWTKLNDPEHGVLDINTQQYENGTYVIINSDPSKQFCSPLYENEYHVGIRLRCISTGGTILNGSIVKYNGEQDLNNFAENPKNEVIVKGWIARDKNNRLYLYSREPLKDLDYWVGSVIIELSEYKFPNIKFEDESPTEVELKININLPSTGE